MALTDADMPQLLAMLNQINIRMQQRRKLAADWTASNDVLRAGEIGLETDTGRRKVGDGSTAWGSLPYQLSGRAYDLANLADGDTPIWDLANARWNHGPGGKVYQPGTGIAIANPASATPTISSTLGSIALSGRVATYDALPSTLGAGDAGKAYLVDADQLIYIWSGSAFPPSGSGAGPHGPHTALWWRLLITNSTAPGYCCLGELEMYSAWGNPNVCQAGTGTVDSVFSSAYPASNAFDGQKSGLSQPWASANTSASPSSPHWIAYKCPFLATVNIVGLWARSDTSNLNAPVDFKVQSSNDGALWSDEWTVSGVSGWTQGGVKYFARS